MKKDTIGDISRSVRNAASDMQSQTVSAYDIKRRDIEDNIIPKKAMAALTEAEVRRAERFGLVIGVMVIIGAIIAVVWWLL
jgi:hypothetical protein